MPDCTIYSQCSKTVCMHTLTGQFMVLRLQTLPKPEEEVELFPWWLSFLKMIPFLAKVNRLCINERGKWSGGVEDR